MPNPAFVSSREASNLQRVYWLQVATILWMVAECGISLMSATSARSPALLAFGTDSLIELFSALVALLQFVNWVKLTHLHAARIGGILLLLLAAFVGCISIISLLSHAQPEPSRAGIAITTAALVLMPLLAWSKRKEAIRLRNTALSADSTQSAMCAYLAAVTLSGLVINQIWNVRWADPVAALLAIPFLVIEGRRSLKGHTCGCGS